MSLLNGKLTGHENFGMYSVKTSQPYKSGLTHEEKQERKRKHLEHIQRLNNEVTSNRHYKLGGH